MGPTEYAIVVLVVGTRLLLPLTIPYYPLPGIVACMLLDAIDQSIFQQFPSIPLDGYQSYDKALDIYYLAIAYTATLRNWINPRAFKMSMFLYYYRLVGVVAFELSQVRALLFIFPNTFEYFFDFYEAVRLRWNTARMGKWTVILATAFIWIFIKLPQEWWIHIAQLDMTDFIKEELFGVSTDATWAEAVGNNPMVVVWAVVIAVALVAVAWWVITRKAPPADHGPRLKADPLPAELQGAELYRIARTRQRLLDRALAEKVVLLGLISVIFSQILLDEPNTLHVIVFVAIFVAANAFVSQVLARRGRAWDSVAVEFVVMAVVNLGLAVGLDLIQRIFGIAEGATPFLPVLFMVGILTVLIVLFDRFHTVFVARGVLEGRAQTQSVE